MEDKTASKLPSNSFSQVILLGLICFCCPGAFNALNGMGGGGQVDTTVASNANVALYTTFSVFSLISCLFVEYLGAQTTLFIGGLTYASYSLSLLVYNINQTQFLVISAGGLLGLGAAMLWTAQGTLMLIYPTENERGKFISTFWIIFNLGGVIGGLVPFILNYSSNVESVNDATYIGFAVMMVFGSMLSFLLKPIGSVIKSDGSKVELISRQTSIFQELYSIILLLKDSRALMMLPAFFSSNFFYAYQFNAVNGTLFNIRTRGLSNSFYWASQMLSAYLFGRFMDRKGSNNALNGLILVFLVSFTAWISGYFLQTGYSRDIQPVRIDFTSSGYIIPILIYILYGILDAIYQNYIYWIIAWSVDAQELSKFIGLYKAFQSAGGAISWRLDAEKTGFMTQLLVNAGLMTSSLLILGILVLKSKSK